LSIFLIIKNYLPTVLAGMVVTSLDMTSVAVAVVVVSLGDDDSVIKE
jgi:hypothetical protein